MSLLYFAYRGGGLHWMAAQEKQLAEAGDQPRAWFPISAFIRQVGEATPPSSSHDHGGLGQTV